VRLSATHTADQRDQVLTELRQQQIGCGRYFAPIHLQPAYRGLDQGELLPVTESVASRTIALPFFNRIESRQVTKVCDVLRAAVERIS
jgi:perosamine synthetase